MRFTKQIVLLLSVICLYARAAEDGNNRAAFESHYEAWKRHCERVQMSSLVDDRLESPDFQAIIKMGPDALPLVAEKCIRDTNFHWIGWAWIELTKLNNDPAVNPWARDSAKTWWEGGRDLAKKRFLSQYDAWKKAKREGRTQEAEMRRKAIRSMGILALGPMMDIMETDDESIPFIIDVVGDEIGDKKGDKQTIRSWWAANKLRYELPKASGSPNK